MDLYLDPDAQPKLEQLLAEFQVVPVGTGFIDLILPIPQAILFIDRLATLAIAVEQVTWWCHCTPESRVSYGCPHGYGGPQAPNGGWYSECVQYPDFMVFEQGVQIDAEPADFAEATRAILHTYLTEKLPKESFFSPCLCPGLWLNVPSYWDRQWYKSEGRR